MMPRHKDVKVPSRFYEEQIAHCKKELKDARDNITEYEARALYLKHKASYYETVLELAEASLKDQLEVEQDD